MHQTSSLAFSTSRVPVDYFPERAADVLRDGARMRERYWEFPAECEGKVLSLVWRLLKTASLILAKCVQL